MLVIGELAALLHVFSVSLSLLLVVSLVGTSAVHSLLCVSRQHFSPENTRRLHNYFVSEENVGHGHRLFLFLTDAILYAALFLPF